MKFNTPTQESIVIFSEILLESINDNDNDNDNIKQYFDDTYTFIEFLILNFEKIFICKSIHLLKSSVDQYITDNVSELYEILSIHKNPTKILIKDFLFYFIINSFELF